MYLSPDIPFPVVITETGDSCDLKFLRKDSWLMDTEVRYALEKKKGLWQLTMVYVAVENPFKLYRKTIDAYHSEKKALLYARLLQRGIRKDARGTLKTNRDAFNICHN